MADDLGVTAGSGRTVRAKEINGKLIQYLGALTAIPTPVTGNQALSVGTGSDTTLTVPSGATHALVCVNPGGGDIRFWEDGSSPSTTAGLLIQAGETAELTNLSNIKMRASSSTVTIHVAYRRYDQ
jgi:hypothetical protein